MALTMLDKKAVAEDRSEWPAELKTEFERESRQNNGCVGNQLLSETDKVRIWIIRLAPGERIGFHRHVLNYFWTSVNGGPMSGFILKADAISPSPLVSYVPRAEVAVPKGGTSAQRVG